MLARQLDMPPSDFLLLEVTGEGVRVFSRRYFQLSGMGRPQEGSVLCLDLLELAVLERDGLRAVIAHGLAQLRMMAAVPALSSWILCNRS